MPDRKVLVVEDDEAMAVALQDGFAYDGYEVMLARDGAAGLAAARDDTADVLILDVMLPRMTGLEVCRTLRSEGSRLPIIMLTARGQEIDKVLGLKLGADDYVTKPFSFMELLARVEAVLRRSDPAGGGLEHVVEIGDLTVDLARHQAHRGAEVVELSPREVEMVRFFAAHRGRVVTREQLLEGVWEYDEIPYTRTVDTHVAKLRKKIEPDPGNPRHLVTVHRVGYKLVG